MSAVPHESFGTGCMSPEQGVPRKGQKCMSLATFTISDVRRHANSMF